MGKPQDQAGRAACGNGCEHGRRGCFQFKSDPGLRLSQQPAANRAKGKTCQEHQDDRHRLYIDRHTLSQEIMNGFQKVEKIKASPSNDLDLPEGPQIQDILSIHKWHSSLGNEAAFHGLARKTFDSSHLSIARRIRSGISTSLS
ncbi:MAG TPA: hypothetical protein VME23_15830 [Terracidiphilus sp.]|nr:hypothetical protein [Terracidiphilus sp.]